MKTQLIRSLVIVVLFSFAVPMTQAQDADLKQRLEQRLPTMDALRQRQIVGENNRGFLEVRGQATTEETQLVEAENRDRAEVYAIIARRSETTVDTVGRTRAKKIAASSVTGALVQDAEGNWAVKR